MDVFVFETRDEVWTFESMLVGSSILRELLKFQFWHQLFFPSFPSVGLHMKTYEKENEHMCFYNYEINKSIQFN
jgi:hypothetical protein